MGVLKDRTGEQHGFLTVLEFSHIHESVNGTGRAAVWRCRCRCGTYKNVIAKNLGHTISCGCHRSSNHEHQKRDESGRFSL